MPTRRRLRPRIEQHYDEDRAYPFISSTSPELSESESHTTINVNDTSAADVQNSTSEPAQSSRASQSLTAEEKSKPTMGGSRSPGNADPNAGAQAGPTSLAGCVPKPQMRLPVTYQLNLQITYVRPRQHLRRRETQKVSRPL